MPTPESPVLELEDGQLATLPSAMAFYLATEEQVELALEHGSPDED